MRDAIVGLAGMVVGGALSALSLVALELVAAVIVLLFVLAPADPPPAEALAAPAAASARPQAPRSGAPSEAPGEVQLLTVALGRVLLDGEPMTFDAAVGAYVASVAPGEHRLQILEMLGTGVKAERAVSVTSGRRSQLRYAKGQITDQGSMPIASSSAAAPAAVAAVSEAENPAAQIFDEVIASQRLTNQLIADEIAEEGAEQSAEADQPQIGIEGGKARLNIGGASVDLKIPRLGKR